LSGSVSNTIYLLLVLLIGAVGYWLQSSPRAEIAARRRLRDWRKTGGTVTGSRLEEIRGARLSVPGRLLKIKADLYKPVISYTFPVGDKTYTSAKYKNSFLARGEEWLSADRQSVDKIVAAHRPGQSVTVNYDPDDPANAYLELDSSISQLFVFRTSGIVLILAAALLFMRSAYNTSGDLLAGRTQPEPPPVFPVACAELRAGLEDRLGFDCQYNGIFHETYESWLCIPPPPVRPNNVTVYCRRQALEKTDVLTAMASQVNSPNYFVSLLIVALPQTDRNQVRDWIAQTAPLLDQTGGKAETRIDGVPFILSSPFENTLQLDIGEFRE
jgi:hypothetical protein